MSDLPLLLQAVLSPFCMDTNNQTYIDVVDEIRLDSGIFITISVSKNITIKYTSIKPHFYRLCGLETV
jgi:hypothetical protein